MKTFLLSFLALFSALAFTPPAHAVAASAFPIRILLSSGAARDAQGNLVCTNCGNVTTSTWVDLSASLPKAIKGITLYNTASVPFKLSIGISGAEVTQMIIPAGHDNDGQTISEPMNSGNHFYPIALSQGAKVSIEALNSSAIGGGLYGTFYSY